MKQIELTDEEYQLLKDIFNEHGSDCPGVDTGAMQALAEKLDIWEPIPPPTEEELKRRKEFAESPLGKQMSEMFKRSNENMAAFLLQNQKDNVFISGAKWDKVCKIGSTLKIKLPNDYIKLTKMTLWEKFKYWWNNGK